MAISKTFRTCTSGIYQNFSSHSFSQKVLRVALPILAIGVVAIYIYRKWTAQTGPVTKPTVTTLDQPKTSTTQPTTSTTLGITTTDTTVVVQPEKTASQLTSTTSRTNNTAVTQTNTNTTKPTNAALNRYKATDIDYRTPAEAIVSLAKTTEDEPVDSLVQARLFINQAADTEGNIRLWNTDDPRKISKAAFLELAKQWKARGGKFVYPEEGKAVFVEANTVCMPWCHEGKNRSALVYDYLRRAGHQETLLPEGAKDGHLCPGRIVDTDYSADNRYLVISQSTGFRSGKVVRSGEKLLAENIDVQQGFTDLFTQLATLNQPVMLFAFVSAVPILMREIMTRTGTVNLSNITIVGFHHDDPMTVASPTKDQTSTHDTWVVKYKDLTAALKRGQQLEKDWADASAENAKLRREEVGLADLRRKRLTDLCKELSEEKAPIETELLFYRRLDAMKRFQTEVLARLIHVQG